MRISDKTYCIDEVLKKATKTNTVPIHRTVWIHIIFKIIHSQTATDGTHFASFRPSTQNPKQLSNLIDQNQPSPEPQKSLSDNNYPFYLRRRTQSSQKCHSPPRTSPLPLPSTNKKVPFDLSDREREGKDSTLHLVTEHKHVKD